MEPNNELMILSLLNLYTCYKNLKKSAKNPVYKSLPNRAATKTKPYGQNYSGISSKHRTIQKQKSGIEDCNISSNHAENSVKAIAGDGQSSLTASQINQANSDDQIATTTITKKQTLIRTQKRRDITASKELKQKKRRIRRWGVRPINIDRARTGYHRKVFLNVKVMDEQQFFEHTRMSKSLYDWLLSFTHSSLRKSRQSILSEERLALTLNYLAHGTSLQSIAFRHKIGKSTARQIVLDTCDVLVTLLSPLYLSKPTSAQYIDIAEDFEKKWHIPNCVGAIDGKRLRLSNPRNKDDNTLILLAACDAKYRFSSANLAKLNELFKDDLPKLLASNCATISDDLDLPPNKPLCPSACPFPYYFIADTAFSLRKNIMRPYTEKNLNTTKSIFNFKISRARSIIENTFGILTARFRVLLTTIEFLPETCTNVILACIALHNYIMTNDEAQLYCPADFVDQENDCGIIKEGEWRKVLKNNGDQSLPSIDNENSDCTNEAKNLRDILASFFACEAISYEIEVV